MIDISLEIYKKDFKKSRGPKGGLHVITGSLRRSIESGIDIRGNNIVGWLGSDLIYAPTHEFGYPPRNIPQRPFIEPGITENIEQIKNIIQNSITKEMNK